jgi:hypothetical protein
MLYRLFKRAIFAGQLMFSPILVEFLPRFTEPKENNLAFGKS